MSVTRFQLHSTATRCMSLTRIWLGHANRFLVLDTIEARAQHVARSPRTRLLRQWKRRYGVRAPAASLLARPLAYRRAYNTKPCRLAKVASNTHRAHRPASLGTPELVVGIQTGD